MTAEQQAEDPLAASGPRSRAYRVVEGAHLRQWLSRATVPLAVACTSGAGLLDVGWLPPHDAPLALLGLPAGVEPVLRVAGGALVLASAWWRVASKGVLVRRTTLTTGGAYAHVRHPFYVAVMLGNAGVLLLAGALGAVAAVVWLLLAAPVYSVTVAGEEEGLGRLYPGAWRRYADAVPRLIPRPTAARDAGAEPVRITWANLVAEHEPPRLLRFLGGALAVAGCVAGGTPGWVLVVLGALLFAASRLVPGLRPRSRRAYGAGGAAAAGADAR